MPVVKERLDNGWYHIEDCGKVYVYQSCPTVSLEVGDVVEIIDLGDGVCEVVS